MDTFQIHISLSVPFLITHPPLTVTLNKQTTQHSASGQFNNTHTDYVDIVIVRKSLQHLADRGPDQF